MTIRSRILIPMIILTILVSAVVLISNIAQFSKYVEDDIGDYLKAASGSAFNQIETYKSYARTVSMFVSECPVVKEMLENGTYDLTGGRERLIGHVSQHMQTQFVDQSSGALNRAVIDFCTITDASGNVVIRTHEPHAYGDNVSEVISTKSALSGQHTAVLEAGGLVKMRVSSGTPIYSNDGELLGTVATGFRLDTNDFVDSIAELFDCVVTVCLGDERISTTLTQEDGTRAVGTKLPPEVAKVVLAGGTVDGRVPILGREAIVRYEPMRDNDGVVEGVLLVASYLDKATATIGYFVEMGILSTFVVMAISAPLIIMISRRIARPINEASGVLGEIAGGNFAARLRGEYKGDLAVLQNSVNDTAAKLSTYLKEKLQEDKIRELAAIVAIADAGVIVKDERGAVRQWNIGAENILGYTPEEMLGNTTHYYAPEESHAGIDEIEARLAKGEHIAHVEVLRKHKDGYLVYCSASYTPIFGEDGGFVGSVSIFHDISDEISAREKMKRFTAVFSMADAGVIIRDKNGIITDWNIGAENILGYTPDEIVGKTTSDFTPKSERETIGRLNAKLMEGDHVRHSEDIKRHKDGRYIYVSASITPLLDDQGDFTGSVIIFHDITEKKQIESALKDALLDTEKKNQTIMASIDYASKIQRSLLPKESVFGEAFEDYSIIWSPRDTVGGDIYWLKSFEEGAVLCVCDCTGHGTPGALLTMIVSTAFEDTVNESNYKDTAQIIWMLEQRLVNAFSINTDEHIKGKISELKDGCDLAVLYVALDGSVTISSGNTHVFVCNGTGVRKIKGQRLYIGEGSLQSARDVQTVRVPAGRDNKFYIASDGLFDQIGGERERPFGYRDFKRIILENHHEEQAVISERIWEAFEAYRGEQPRRDDVELITFKPRGAMPI